MCKRCVELEKVAKAADKALGLLIDRDRTGQGCPPNSVVRVLAGEALRALASLPAPEERPVPRCPNCVYCRCEDPERCGGCGAKMCEAHKTAPGESHKRVYEYDGAYWCRDCGSKWGALPDNPEMPKKCDKPVPREPCKHPGPCHPEWCGRPRESGKEG